MSQTFNVSLPVSGFSKGRGIDKILLSLPSPQPVRAGSSRGVLTPFRPISTAHTNRGASADANDTGNLYLKENEH